MLALLLLGLLALWLALKLTLLLGKGLLLVVGLSLALLLGFVWLLLRPSKRRRAPALLCFPADTPLTLQTAPAPAQRGTLAPPSGEAAR